MKKLLWAWSVFFLFVSACSGQPAATQTETLSTTTLLVDDPCAAHNLPTTVQPLNNLTREFDEASQVAPSLSAQQLPEVISNLQRIRRAAEDVKIPACLETLKTHQLNYMNLMIQSLLAFVGGADQAALADGLAKARQEQNLYSLEIVRLLGITLAPLTMTPETPAP